MHLNNPETILPHPGPWEKLSSPQSWPLVQKSWGPLLEYCWTTEPHTHRGFSYILILCTNYFCMWLNPEKQAEPVEDKTWPPKVTTIATIVSYIIWWKKTQMLKTYCLGSNYGLIEETVFFSFIPLYNIMYVCTYMYIMYVCPYMYIMYVCTYTVCLSFLIVFPPFVFRYLKVKMGQLSGLTCYQLLKSSEITIWKLLATVLKYCQVK